MHADKMDRHIFLLTFWHKRSIIEVNVGNNNYIFKRAKKGEFPLIGIFCCQVYFTLFNLPEHISLKMNFVLENFCCLVSFLLNYKSLFWGKVFFMLMRASQRRWTHSLILKGAHNLLTQKAVFEDFF